MITFWTTNMETSKFISVTVLSVALFWTLASAADLHRGSKLRQIKFVECDFNKTKGAVCVDCYKRLICTPVGGLELPCLWPGKENCFEGKCQSEPSDTCKNEEPAPEEEFEENPENKPDPVLERVFDTDF